MKKIDYRKIHNIKSEIGQLEYRVRVHSAKIDKLKKEMSEELCPYKKGDTIYLEHSPNVLYDVDSIENHPSGWRIIAFKLNKKTGLPTLIQKFILPIDPTSKKVL
jgi:hypothetical protein